MSLQANHSAMFQTKTKPTIILAATTLALTTAVAFGLKSNANSTHQPDSTTPRYDAPYTVHSQNLRPVSASIAQPTDSDDAILLKLAAHDLHSQVAYAYDVDSGEVRYENNHYLVRPIASITKLMSAMAVLLSDQHVADMVGITC